MPRFFFCGYLGRENAYCVCLCVLLCLWGHEITVMPQRHFGYCSSQTRPSVALNTLLVLNGCLSFRCRRAWLPSPLQDMSLCPCRVWWGVLSSICSLGVTDIPWPADLWRLEGVLWWAQRADMSMLEILLCHYIYQLPRFSKWTVNS